MPHPAYIAVPVVAVAAVATIAIQSGLPSKIDARKAKAVEQAKSYLFPAHLPDSLQLPPPPSPGSPKMKRDQEARAAALKFKGTPRYDVARADSKRDQALTVDAFSCALGTGITKERTPTLYRMLSAIRVDVRASASAAKARYMRLRPFVYYHTETCSPTDEALVQDQGSYPSARAAVGFAYALVLSELNPARTDAIMERGREFGESRLICDGAWQSDVDAGHTLATENVLRLRHNKDFQNDMAAARAELQVAMHEGLKPTGDCRKEAVALATR